MSDGSIAFVIHCSSTRQAKTRMLLPFSADKSTALRGANDDMFLQFGQVAPTCCAFHEQRWGIRWLSLRGTFCEFEAQMAFRLHIRNGLG